MNEAQKCLYLIAENMRMDKSISKEGYEYFQQATKALEQEPTTKNNLAVDCISRQAVLNFKQTFHDNAGYETEYVDIEDIKALPPVTPKYTDEEIDQAQAVEQAYVDKMVELSVNDVLDKIRNEITMLHIFNRANVIEIIDKYKAENITPQEPRKGHWITHIKSDRGGDYCPTNPYCSVCGGEPNFTNTIFNYKYCPYCGSYNGESEDKE